MLCYLCALLFKNSWYHYVILQRWGSLTNNDAESLNRAADVLGFHREHFFSAQFERCLVQLPLLSIDAGRARYGKFARRVGCAVEQRVRQSSMRFTHSQPSTAGGVASASVVWGGVWRELGEGTADIWSAVPACHGVSRRGG